MGVTALTLFAVVDADVGLTVSTVDVIGVAAMAGATGAFVPEGVETDGTATAATGGDVAYALGEGTVAC